MLLKKARPDWPSLLSFVALPRFKDQVIFKRTMLRAAGRHLDGHTGERPVHLQDETSFAKMANRLPRVEVTLLTVP